MSADCESSGDFDFDREKISGSVLIGLFTTVPSICCSILSVLFYTDDSDAGLFTYMFQLLRQSLGIAEVVTARVHIESIYR